jgi:Na+/proline symporter
MLTVAAGLFGTISAVLISKMDPGSLWELILLLVGLFGSSLTGVFLLGVFTRRASARGVALGVAASIMSLIMLRTFDIPIHGFLTAAVGCGGWLCRERLPADPGSPVKESHPGNS